MTTRPRPFLEAWRAMRTAFSLASAAAQREEDAPALEAGNLEQPLGERAARLRAPGGGHEASLSACALIAATSFGCWWPRLLHSTRLDMSSSSRPPSRTASRRARRRPSGHSSPRHAPAVQHEITLVGHPAILSRLHCPGARSTMGPMKYRQLPAAFALFGIAGALVLGGLRRACAGGRDAPHRDAALRRARRAADRRCRDPGGGRQDPGGRSREGCHGRAARSGSPPATAAS